MNLPINMLKSWERVNKRIDEFCDGDLKNSFRMLFVTDVHIGAENRNHIKQLEFVRELTKMDPVDLIVNGGDIGLDVGESDDDAREVLKITKENTNFDIPYFLLKGNHDFKESIISDQELNILLNSYLLDKNDKSVCEFINDKDSNGYGYYIDKKTDTKILFLNTSEKYKQYVILDKQLKYILKQLENTKEKNLIILSHHCINKCGSWKSENNQYGDGIVTIQKALKDFVKKAKGSYKGNSWDFTNNKTTLHLYLSGDSHFNNKSNDDGYTICCRQGSGGCTPNDVPEGAIYDVFDKTEQCNFDILVINKNNKVKLFRVGEGEEILDI